MTSSSGCSPTIHKRNPWHNDVKSNNMYVQTIAQFVLHLFLSQNNVRPHESEAAVRAESVINVHTKKTELGLLHSNIVTAKRNNNRRKKKKQEKIPTSMRPH